ncbi:hypothetical protein ABEB36_012811 [Hypothenemus hampei]|uniref:Retrotransposon gag domain-containing protein n=1 Tax=Hypothenemus hampei TaxID=57062 RepID=A0ABD1E7Z8_HYPHA
MYALHNDPHRPHRGCQIAIYLPPAILIKPLLFLRFGCRLPSLSEAICIKYSVRKRHQSFEDTSTHNLKPPSPVLTRVTTIVRVNQNKRPTDQNKKSGDPNPSKQSWQTIRSTHRHLITDCTGTLKQRGTTQQTSEDSSDDSVFFPAVNSTEQQQDTPTIETTILPQQATTPTPAERLDKTPIQHPNMANNSSVGQASNQTLEPSKPSFIQPPTFHPSIDSPTTFLMAYERVASGNRWSDNNKIAYLEYYLEGSANLWFRRYVADPGNSTNTWDRVKKDLKIEYLEDTRRGTNLFHKKRQGRTESIKQYYLDLENLAGEMDPDMPFDIFREQFEKGLHPKFRKLYITLADEDISREAFRKTIRKIHEIKEAAQEEESRPHPYNSGYNRPYQYNQRGGHTHHKDYNDNHHKDTYNSGPKDKTSHSSRTQEADADSQDAGTAINMATTAVNKPTRRAQEHTVGTTQTNKDGFQPPSGSRPPHKQRTRSSRNIIQGKLTTKRNHLPKKVILTDYSGHRTEITENTTTEVELGGTTIPMDFLVKDASPYPVILGAQFIKETRPLIDCDEESITIKHKHGTAKIKIHGLEPDTRLDELDPEKTKHQQAPTETKINSPSATQKIQCPIDQILQPGESKEITFHSILISQEQEDNTALTEITPFTHKKGILISKPTSRDGKLSIEITSKNQHPIKILKGTTLASLRITKENSEEKPIFCIGDIEDDQVTIKDHDLNHIREIPIYDEIKGLLECYNDVFSKNPGYMGKHHRRRRYKTNKKQGVQGLAKGKNNHRRPNLRDGKIRHYPTKPLPMGNPSRPGKEKNQEKLDSASTTGS